MSTSSVSFPHEHESTVPIIDLLNKLNTLLKDYSHVHGAPKQVHDTLTDIEYLREALATVMSELARHSARVNGWCEGRRCVEVEAI